MANDSHRGTSHLREFSARRARLRSRMRVDRVHLKTTKQLSKYRRKFAQTRRQLETMQQLFETFTCSICFDNDVDHTTSCGHMFCWACIDEWRKHSLDCPTCREPIQKIVRVHLGLSSNAGRPRSSDIASTDGNGKGASMASIPNHADIES